MPDTAIDTDHRTDHGTGACFDEGYAEDGSLRPAYRQVLTRLGEADLDSLARRTRRLLDERGVRFGGADGHTFVVDPVPRILDAGEWQQLTAGLRQRVRALEAFLDDAYGEQRAVHDGVIPERVVTGSAYFEPDLRGVRPARGARVSVAGLDVVRDSRGEFRVLEDNLRTPSGIAYALAASEAVAEVLGQSRPHEERRRAVGEALRRVMEASASDTDGALVLLTDGPENTAYYEHATLADLAGLELVTPAGLRRRGNKVELSDGRPVRGVYHRTGDDTLRDASGELTPVAALLLDPVREGQVGLVNWFGNGVADDKEVYGFVDDMIRYYLGEEPRLRSVRTYDLTDAARLEEVLEGLSGLVVKPRAGQGGEGVVVGPAASPAELDRARDALRAAPEEWIAQEVVSLSTHPTVIDGRLSPRHVDLRPFVFHDGREALVSSEALSRVALAEGSMVVNTSQDGGAKATWVG